MEKTIKKLNKIPAFNDHGPTCHGHANFMLDCTYEKKEDRDLITNILDNYYGDQKGN